jgi:hypothetical protein
LILGQGCLNTAADVIEHGLFLEPVLRVKAVIGRPILVMPVLGAQQTTDGMPAECGQVGKQMAASPMETVSAGKGGSADIDEFF